MNTTFASHLSILQSHHVALAMASVSTNAILGLPLNGYVMWLILAQAKGTSDFFSLNLAMSEIAFSLSGLCYFVYVKINLFFSFEVFMFSLGLLFTARPLFQSCICVECYVGVVHPVLFLRYKPLRYKAACGCVAWLITLVSCIYSMFKYSNPVYLYGFFTQNLLFFFVMLFSCLSVLRALKHPGPGEKDRERKKSNTMKRRAFKTIMLIMITMAINFSLYVGPIPLQCCLQAMEFTRALTICIGLALIIGFIQPLLYLHRAGKLFCLSKL